MKKLLYFGMIAFLFVIGCSKEDEVSVVNPAENQLKSTVSPIAPWGSPAIWDDNAGVLKTALWYPPALGALPNYSFTQFPNYDFTPYYLNGETEYNPYNYDLMAHFGYISPVAVTGLLLNLHFLILNIFFPI